MLEGSISSPLMVSKGNLNKPQYQRAHRGVVSQDLVRESLAERYEGLKGAHRRHRDPHPLTRSTK